MIYNRQETLAPFNDSYVRAADVMLDTLYNKANITEEQSMGLIGYVLDYRFVHIRVPRRVGKSTYLKKVANHLANTEDGSVIFIGANVASIASINHKNILTYTIYHNISLITSRKDLKISAIIFDEISAEKCKNVLFNTLNYFSITDNFVVFGMSTN